MREWTPREILAYLDRVEPVLDRLDYFELLDVSANASDADIQRAFHAMAAGIHPDRHRKMLSDGQRERLMIVYARIAEAYRVLRDPKHRESYLKEALRQRKDSGTTTEEALDEESAMATLNPKAKRLYRRAQTALRTGDMMSAMLNMRMALAKQPQSAFLRQAMKDLKRAGKG